MTSRWCSPKRSPDAGSTGGATADGGRDDAARRAARRRPARRARDGRWLRAAQRGATSRRAPRRRVRGHVRRRRRRGRHRQQRQPADSARVPGAGVRRPGRRPRDGAGSRGAAGDADDAGRLVLGPAADGGYYLIGAARETWARRRAAITGLLAASPMSTASLLSYTLRAAKARGLEVTQLPLWIDIDRAGDLGALARLTGDAPCAASRCRVCARSTSTSRTAARATAATATTATRHRDPDELTTDEWIDAIDQCAALGAGSFVFIGGDPLLRPDFARLVDHITGSRGARARFFFNSFVSAEDGGRAGEGRPRPPHAARQHRRAARRSTTTCAAPAATTTSWRRSRICAPPASSPSPTPCSCGRCCPASCSSRASCTRPASAGST